jgi:hypothetical protein
LKSSRPDLQDPAAATPAACLVVNRKAAVQVGGVSMHDQLTCP